ncbi:mechanosensitive ion channel family protein [Conexibacter sp. DBS9H8]|uniref:mechanosensitive ion channel family protein n=1 Tax=Conexibacter sp. DBS9H8 TaxID=2937801 RepID=UPI00200BC88C|nr:mechanosensitive ion channel family protein [Conexibacter sp. DBS9H8]
MRRISDRQRERARSLMFDTRSDAWAAVGLELEVNTKEISRARRRLLASLILLIATVVGKSMALHHWAAVYASTRHSAHPHHWLINSKSPFELLAMLIVLALGWLISKDLGRLAPSLFRRMDPATAGTVEFLIRLVTVVATVLGAITIAGVSTQVVAVGGAFTAVVVGLAAQQTLGNLFAGMVLLSAQPFRLGERVRLYAGAIGQQEGTVSSLGLLYTSLSRGANRIMIPNTLVLAAVVVPLREAAPVDVRVRLNAGVQPSQAQAILDAELSQETLRKPTVALEEIDGDAVYIRVQATPEDGDESAHLADQIIQVLRAVTGEHETLTPSGEERD